MKKKIQFVVFATLLIIGGFNVILSKNDSDKAKQELSELQIENIEAFGGLFETIANWWNRPDYSCVMGPCYRYMSGGYGVRYENEKIGNLPHLEKDKGNGDYAHRQTCECEAQGGSPNIYYY